MKKGLSATVLMLVWCIAFAQLTPQQGAEEAKKVPLPDAKAIINPGSAANSVPQYGADVSGQSGLFQGGKGNPIPDGTGRVAGCSGANDPECLAIQVISGGKAARPAVDPTAIDQLVGSRNTIVGNMNGILGPNPGGMVGEGSACHDVTRIEPPLFDTEVCDIRVPTSEATCSVGWDVQVDPDYVYRCLQRINVSDTQTCSVGRQIVVDATTLYKCIEQFQVESGAACTVGRVVTVDPDYNYQCEVRPSKLVTYQCNRTLTVTGDPGCSVGQFYTSFASDPNGLGQDACDGGDNLWLSYQCGPGAPPTLRVETNVKNQPNFVFFINTDVFDQTYAFSNCRGRWYGNTVCSGTSCVTNIIMEVSIYTAPYCDGNGCYPETIWPLGALGKVFSYVTYSLINEQDSWVNGCTALEQRAQ